MNQKFAYDDGSGRNADANLERGTGSRPEIRYRIDQCERSAHCLLGVVLLRSRIPEIGEHAIACVSSDHALVATDHLSDAGVVRCDHPPHVLRVQSCRKGRRADQIAEYYRQGTSLGLIRWDRFSRCISLRDSGAIEVRNGAQYFAAMPQKHAEFLEIFICQIAEDREVNRILGKPLSVLFQS